MKTKTVATVISLLILMMLIGAECTTSPQFTTNVVGEPKMVTTPLPTKTPKPGSSSSSDGGYERQTGSIGEAFTIPYSEIIRCYEFSPERCGSNAGGQTYSEFMPLDRVCLAWREEGNPVIERVRGNPENIIVRITVKENDHVVYSIDHPAIGYKSCWSQEFELTPGEYSISLSRSDSDIEIGYKWMVATPIPTKTFTPTLTPTITLTPTETPIPTLGVGSTIVGNDGMTLVYVPASEFIMGSTDADTADQADEKPQHPIYLDAYWIDQTEVTNAMFAKFVENTGYTTEAEKNGGGYSYIGNNYEFLPGSDWRHPNGPSSDIVGLDWYPVVQVSWNDALAYCTWIGRRLPTEAEWEKAGRGTDGRIYPWGDTPVTGYLVNFADASLNANWSDPNVNDGYPFTAPVGSFKDGISPYNLLDMAGNVWEWVADYYDAYFYASTPYNNPVCISGDGRVLRGGSWINNAQYVRIAERGFEKESIGSNITGFRCVQADN